MRTGLMKGAERMEAAVAAMYDGSPLYILIYLCMNA